MVWRCNQAAHVLYDSMKSRHYVIASVNVSCHLAKNLYPLPAGLLVLAVAAHSCANISLLRSYMNVTDLRDRYDFP